MDLFSDNSNGAVIIGEVNAMTPATVMKYLMFGKSKIGKLNRFVTYAVKKRWATKWGEDAMFQLSRDPKSVLNYVIKSDENFKQALDNKIDVWTEDFNHELGIENLAFLKALRTLANDPDTPYTRKDVLFVQKYMANLVKLPAVVLTERVMSKKEKVSYTSIVNGKVIIESYNDTVLYEGPAKFIGVLARYDNDPKKLRNQILVNLASQADGKVEQVRRGKTWINPQYLASGLEAITGIKADLWLKSYTHGQQTLAYLTKEGAFDVFKTHDRSGTHASGAAYGMSNLLFQLNVLKKGAIKTEDNAREFLTKVFINDSAVPNAKGRKIKRPSAIKLLATNTFTQSAIDGSYSSVTSKPASSYMLRSQALDMLQDWLKENGLNPLEDIITVDGVNHTCRTKDGRAYSRNLVWSDMQDADRLNLSRSLMLDGYMELGQIGDKTVGLFARIPGISDYELMALRHFFNSFSKENQGEFFSRAKAIFDRFYNLYSEQYKAMTPLEQSIMVNPDTFKDSKYTVTDLYDLIYAKLNADWIKRLDGPMENYVKKGKFDVALFFKRRSQAGTGGTALADGKPIRMVLVDDLDSEKVAQLKDLAEALSKQMGIRSEDAAKLFDGLGVFSKGFGKRYGQAMGTDENPFGIKAHYRDNGTLVKVNWINAEMLDAMGDSLFGEIGKWMNTIGADVLVFKQTGMKTGAYEATNIWGTDPESPFAPAADVKLYDLDPNRFYTPLSLNQSADASIAKSPKQQEHNTIHLKGGEQRARLSAQLVALRKPIWEAKLKEYKESAIGRTILPDSVEDFKSEDGKTTYVRIRNDNKSDWFTYPTREWQRNPEMVPSKRVSRLEAASFYKKQLWRDLFGTNDDLIEAVDSGENPFGLLLYQRTLPLLVSKLKRVMEVGGERVMAQAVPSVSNARIRDMFKAHNRVHHAPIIANLVHRNGLLAKTDMPFPSREKLMEYLLGSKTEAAHKEQHVYAFQITEEGTPDYANVNPAWIEERGSLTYLLGELVNVVHVPSTNVQSGIITTLAATPDIMVAAVMLHHNIVNGLDGAFDGAQFQLRMLHYDWKGNVILDESERGIENRILLLYLKDANDPAQYDFYRQRTRGNTSVVPSYQAEGMLARAEQADKGPINLNGRQTNWNARRNNVISQSAIGVATAMNRFVDFVTHYGIESNVWEKPNPFANQVMLDIQPMNADQAYEFKRLVTAPLITLTADDRKDPILNAMNLGPDGISLFIVRALSNPGLRDAGKSYEEKKAIVAQLLKDMRSKKMKTFTRALAFRKYGIESQEGINPLFFNLHPAKDPKYRKRGKTIFDFIEKDKNLMGEYLAGKAFQGLNSALNYSMRDIKANDINEIVNGQRNAQALYAGSGAFNFKSGWAISGYQTILGDVMDAFRMMKDVDFTQRPEWERLMKKAGFGDQVEKVIRAARKEISLVAMSRHMPGNVIDADWYQENYERILANEESRPEDAFIQMLQLSSDEDPKIELNWANRGALAPDMTLWGKMPETMQNGLLKYAIERYGYGIGVRTGTWLPYVDRNTRVRLSKAVDQEMAKWARGMDAEGVKSILDLSLSRADSDSDSVSNQAVPMDEIGERADGADYRQRSQNTESV